jgi:hypothetical protein
MEESTRMAHTASDRRRPLARLAAPLIAAVLLWVAPTALAASPAQPVLAGSVSNSTSLSGAVSVATSANYAYTTAYYAGALTAINISNPSSPSVAPSGPPPASSLFASTNVTIAGGYAFVVSKNRNASTSSNDDGTGNSLTILDIHTKPAVPAIVGSVHDPNHLFGGYGVAVSGNYAFVAAQGLLAGQPTSPLKSAGAFDVVDISNLGGPKIVATIDNGALPAPWAGSNALDHADSVSLSGNYAYVTASYSNRLTVLDVSNPLMPKIVASLQGPTTLNFPVDVATQGNYAYVADQIGPNGRLTTVDISNPLAPKVVGSLAAGALNGAYRLRVRGNFAFVSGSSSDAISAVDISNPVSPRLAGSITDTAHLHRTTGLALDSTGGYVIANSPYLSTQSNSTYPPYPGQPGGPTLTGTISVINLDPNPIGVTITSGPPTTTGQTSASFTFTTTDAVASVRCQRDGGALGLCTSPTGQSYTGLGQGSHKFTVVATDATGNTSSATYTWTISGHPAPTVAITTPPNGATYPVGAVVTASYSCTAATGTTLTSCVGTTAKGARISTSKAGSYTFTVTAKQSDGQSTTVTHTYKVGSGSRKAAGSAGLAVSAGSALSAGSTGSVPATGGTWH